MPRIVHETTAARQELIDRRVKARQAAVAALPAPSIAPKLHRLQSQARTWASKAGCPNTEVSAWHEVGGWVGVVCLRPDQSWMRDRVLQAGCLVGEA